ncbi:PrpF protein [Aspergillus floccosus]
MISAVGPFAVDSQLVPVQPDGHAEADLRIHNTNTGKIIRSRFPVEDGEAASSGSFAIDGVAGTAAKIQLDFLEPAGSRTGALLPTEKVVDTFDGVSTTCIDVGNPCCFVLASDLGVEGTITPDEIDAHPTLLPRLDSIRRQAGVAMGLADHPDGVPGSVPKIGIVSAPPPNTQASGPAVDVVVRALSVGQPHRAVPITVALALAAAAKVPGSVVASMTVAPPVGESGITLGHASGTLMVGAEFRPDGQLSHATVFRTARRLMEGRVFWKA